MLVKQRLPLGIKRQKVIGIAIHLFMLLCLTLLLMAQSGAATNTFWYQVSVPGVQEKHLSVDYWINKLDKPQQLLLSAKQIEQLNHLQYVNEPYLHDPLALPEYLATHVIVEMIKEVSQPSKSKRYWQNNQALTLEDYRQLIESLNLDVLSKSNDKQKLEFALVTKRASLRSFPTDARAFSDPDLTDIDRFQESALFPGEAVVLLHTSLDKQWVFVQNYHYRAWVKADALAIANKQSVQEYVNANTRLVVTGAKVFTNFNPLNPDSSEIQLDMGVTLPLVVAKSANDVEIQQQHSYTSFVVSLPTRNQHGQLVLVPTLIAKSADVSIGYLPMTAANILKQAFKFLGERYGWGHDYNGRDCTGFIGEVFKSFGLLLPRNTSQQQATLIGSNKIISLPSTMDNSVERKTLPFSSLQVADLLFMPGHVVMVIGWDDQSPFIIHDAYGLTYIDPLGNTVAGRLNGVSVNRLFSMPTYVEQITQQKRLY